LAEPIIAVVGAESLLGREVRDLLGSGTLAADLRLVSETVPDAATAETKLTALGDEPSFISSLSAAALEGASALVLAGSPATARLVTGLKLEIPIVDIAGALEDQPNARLRAPLLEPHDFRVAPDAIQVIAHPASIAIALVLTRIHQVFPFRKSLVHVFEPASERGSAGIEELQQQTVNLLSFKPLPKKVYDTQIAYTMLPAFGDEAPLPLSDIEARIERHLATLLSLSGNVPIPSLRLVQAPLFHGYSFSLWVEFETNPGVAALQQVLNEPPIEVRDAGLEPPNNVGVAGQSGVSVGAISIDRNDPQAVWFWMAADNLHLAAESASDVLREVI
jgi:aspartate-semialdehyde dehydrogenase